MFCGKNVCKRHGYVTYDSETNNDFVFPDAEKLKDTHKMMFP